LSLRDEHLQQALNHAPDNGLEPSNMVREKVLDYAGKAVKPQNETWLKRSMNMLNNWRVSSWQLAGMSSIAVVLLVIVIVREQLPDESMWNVAEVKDVAQNSADIQPRKEIERDKLESLKKEERVDFTDAKPTIKEKAIADKSALEVVGKISPLEEAKTPTQLAEKAKIPANSPQMADKDSVAVAAAPEPSLVITAPLPATVPASEAVSTVSTEQKNELKRPVVGEATAGARAKVHSVEAVAKPSVASKKVAILDEAKVLGIAKANKDIQAGTLRILHSGDDWPTGKPLVDDVTGYRVELVTATTMTPAEFEAYNQAMREWYLAHKKSPD
jgi:hypothetical protein